MMPVKPVHIQRRMMELGRVRLGEKGAKGEPRKLNTFRITSASKRLLESVAAVHGGTVTAWEGAPDEGYWQVTTEATSLNIILPPVFSEEDGHPTVPYSQWFEMWSGGGCQRRCDGETEALSGGPCLCDPEKRQAGDKSQCQIVTRVSFMLPDLPGLGVFRLDSHGWNAAVELPGTLEVLAQAANQMKFIPAVLSIQHRTKKVEGQTRRFIVPVIELPDVTIRQLAAGDVPLALNVPGNGSRERPALPAAPPPPGETAFQSQGASFGTPPPLPAAGGDAKDAGGAVSAEASVATPPSASNAGAPPAVISEAQRRRLRAIQTANGVSDETLKALVDGIAGVTSSKLIPVSRYEELVAAVEAAAPTESGFKVPAGVQEQLAG